MEADMMRQVIVLALICVITIPGCEIFTSRKKPVMPEKEILRRNNPSMEQKTVDPSVLQFKSAGEGKIYECIHASMANKTAMGGWLHIPARIVGNFIEETWCRGEGADPAGLNSVFMGKRGNAWYQLSTFHYTQSWPEVFGIEVNAGRNPVRDEWGVRFYYASAGGSIVGDGMYVTFVRISDEGREETVTLGDSYAYSIEASAITVRAPEGMDRELAAMTKSPESLRALARKRFDSLLSRTRKELAAHHVKKYVYGPYHNDGIPPEKTEVPLTLEEEKIALGNAEAEIGRRTKAVEEHYLEFHRGLVDVLDFSWVKERIGTP